MGIKSDTLGPFASHSAVVISPSVKFHYRLWKLDQKILNKIFDLWKRDFDASRRDKRRPILIAKTVHRNIYYLQINQKLNGKFNFSHEYLLELSRFFEA